MARGNPSSRNRGFRGGPRGAARGRGRGGANRGRGRGRGEAPFTDDFDFPIQIWADNAASRGQGTPRGRGRGRGGLFSNPNSGYVTPQRGYESPRGRGRGGPDAPVTRGRGRGTFRFRPDAPLSKLLYEERPLLRPVIFVRSVHTATLFEEKEEIFQPVVEEVDDKERSHVPTADRVSRVFSGNFPVPVDSSASEDDEEELEEIDFEDLARIREEVDSAVLPTPTPNTVQATAIEERFTGFFIDTNPTPTATTSHEVHAVEEQTTIMSVDKQPVTTSLLSLSESVTQEMAIEVTLPEPAPEATQAEYQVFYIDTNPTPAPEAAQEEFQRFYIDTNPTPVASALPSHFMSSTTQGPTPLGATDDDDIIVYVAPHPRSGRATPMPPNTPTISLPMTSALTGTTNPVRPASTAPATQQPAAPAAPAVSSPLAAPSAPAPAPAFSSVAFAFEPSPTKQPRQPPAFAVRARAKANAKQRKKEVRAARKRARGDRAAFGLFGAAREEAQLHGGARDARWDERRRGDSDVDWGDEDEDGNGDDGGVGEVSSGMGAMDLDPELEIDVEAMRGFVQGMSAEGARHVTMDDIEDERRMREEDEAGHESGSSAESSGDEEADEVVAGEEEMMIAEALDGRVGSPDEDDEEEEDDDDDDDDAENIDSTDDEQSPRSSFQAQLGRIRRRVQKSKAKASKVSDDYDSSEDSDRPEFRSWADEDDDFIAHIQTLLDENEGALTGRHREASHRLFQAVHNGAFDNVADMAPARRGRDKEADIPPELRAQWQADRARKAARKAARADARLAAAADPLARKRGGKKGRKAMLAAAALDPRAAFAHRVLDMPSLESEIRRFVGGAGGATMALPPMESGARKAVHELALAFGLKSVSRGAGKARYTTLARTARGGGVDERKVRRVVLRFGGGDAGRFGAPRMGGSGGGGGGGGKGRGAVPRHRDGDEVGKAAPKIGETNIGFKMLELMGWSEGDRIGATGGLHVPLTAIIKNTKLGLGAAR